MLAGVIDIDQCNVQKSKLETELPDSFSPSDYVVMPPPDRLCVKCSRVPMVPLLSKCCNRLYCKPCSVENKRCRKHKELVQYTTDKKLRGTLIRLIRKCLNQSKGCNWKGNTRQLIHHLQDNCPQKSMK